MRAALLALGLALTLLPLPALAAAASTMPTASYTVTGVVGSNGWYRGSTGGEYVVVHWTLQDPSLLIQKTSGCEYAIPIYGPTTGKTETCTATLTDTSTIAWTTKVLRIDAGAPTGVSASASRSPDVNGWYNHPVAIAWRGSDATSGIASCTSVTYGGPDRASARVGGGCTDRAGNTASAPVTLNYDATAPVLSKVSVTSEATADVVRWRSSSPTDTVVVQRWARGNKKHPTVFHGTGSRFADNKVRRGLEYMYAVQAIDQAGNASRRMSAAGLPKVLTLHKMGYVPRAAKRPILRWNAVRGASYYHVQLFRGSKRILAAWPTKHQLGLPGKWRWAGHRYRLRPGHYRWYVWAGLGDRAFANYKALGSARFIVPR